MAVPPKSYVVPVKFHGSVTIDTDSYPTGTDLKSVIDDQNTRLVALERALAQFTERYYHAIMMIHRVRMYVEGSDIAEYQKDMIYGQLDEAIGQMTFIHPDHS